jgi:hypothetical protein
MRSAGLVISVVTTRPSHDYHSAVRRSVFAAVALTAIWCVARHGPPVPFSYLDVHVDTGALTVTLIAHIADLANDLKIAPVELLKPDVVTPAPR